jgi:hypothetical protein
LFLRSKEDWIHQHRPVTVAEAKKLGFPASKPQDYPLLPCQQAGFCVCGENIYIQEIRARMIEAIQKLPRKQVTDGLLVMRIESTELQNYAAVENIDEEVIHIRDEDECVSIHSGNEDADEMSMEMESLLQGSMPMYIDMADSMPSGTAFPQLGEQRESDLFEAGMPELRPSGDNTVSGWYHAIYSHFKALIGNHMH